jgi:hypothetical protein
VARPFAGTVSSDIHWEILGGGLRASQNDYIAMSKATCTMRHLGCACYPRQSDAGPAPGADGPWPPRFAQAPRWSAAPRAR